MKHQVFSNSLAVASLITAGLVLTTNAKLQAHGHQHGDVFGRIMHKPIASSGSSSIITTLGAAASMTLRIARPGVAVLILHPGSVALLPTATGRASGPDCFGGDCDPTNVTHHSNPFTHPTPVPQLQIQALEVQDGQLASLPSRRRNRYRVSQTSAIDEAAPVTELSPVSTDPMLAKTSSMYRPAYR